MGPSAEGLLHHKGAFVPISPTKLVISSIRAKKIMKKFGGYSKKAYLCSVKTLFWLRR